MKRENLLLSMVALVMATLAAPVFGQQSAVANSAWNGGFGPWNSPVDWVTNGSLAAAIPNNGDMVLCSVGGVLESCQGFFNITIGTGGFDLATLDTLPVTIDSLTLGASTGSAALDIGSSVADTLTIGDITAPGGGAVASLTVNSTGFLNVFAGSKLDLNIAAGNGTVTNNGAINLNSASGAGSSLLINDAGSAHQLTLSGTGTLTMQPSSVIQGVSGDEFLQNNSTIQGSGTISNLFVANGGIINANGTSPLVIKSNPNPVPVAGLGAHDGAGFTNLGGHTAEASAGSTLVLDTTASSATESPIFNAGGILQVSDGGTVEVIGAANRTTNIGNTFAGQINVGGAGAGGTVKFDGNNATFDLTDLGVSTGTFTLSDNANNRIAGVTGTESLILGANETLSGAGTIRNLALVNNGTVIANGTNALNITPNASGFTNNGILQVNSGSTLNLSGSTTSTNSATVTVDGTLNLPSRSVLTFNIAAGNATVTNNGAINLNSASGAGSSLLINDAGSAHQLTLSGTGTLTMQPSSVIQGVRGDEFLQNNSTIQGAGTISNLFFANEATVEAEGGTLTIDSNPNTIAEFGLGAHDGTGLVNTGMLEATAGSALVLDTTGAVHTQAPLVNVSAVIEADNGGTVEIIGAGNTTTGILNASGGSIDVGTAGSTGGGTLEFKGSNAAFSMGGTGTVVLSDNAANLIAGVTGTESLILGANETLSGAGTIRNLALVNNGTMIANGKNALNITPNASGFTNAGKVTVNSGSNLALNLTNTVGGTGFSNSGTVAVQDGGTLEFSDTNHGSTVTINNFQGNINLGRSTGAQLLLNGAGATFNLVANNGPEGKGTLTMVDSTIKGVSGGETLVNGFANTIEGTGLISNLTLSNTGGELAANGGTLKINANLTNLKSGTLNGGEYLAGDTAPGILQLPGNVTTNSALFDLIGKGSEITDPAGKNALAGLTNNLNGSFGVFNGASLSISGGLTNGANSNASGNINIANGATLTIAGNVTNWGDIDTGLTEGTTPAGSTINVGGTITNNSRGAEFVDEVALFAAGDKLNVGTFKNGATAIVDSGATLSVRAGGSYTQTAGSTDVNGTLMSPSITVTGGTFASNGGVVETTTLKSGASITADSTGFIGVGSGKFTATRGYQELANGTLDELISGKSAFGVIDVTGAASLNGTLDVTLQNGFVPTVGEQFAFLDFTKGDLTGRFADFLGQTFDNGQEDWDLTYDNAIGEVFLTAGSTATCNAVLLSAGSSGGCGTATPEPASLLLLGTGLLGLGFLARKQWGRAN